MVSGFWVYFEHAIQSHCDTCYFNVRFWLRAVANTIQIKVYIKKNLHSFITEWRNHGGYTLREINGLYYVYNPLSLSDDKVFLSMNTLEQFFPFIKMQLVMKT